MFKNKGRRKKYTTIFLLILCSLATLVSFQNCGQGNSSQSSSVGGDNNTVAGTPNPTPGPAPAPGTTPSPTPTPPVNGKVNGVCGTTNNSCTTGTSVDKADVAPNFLWSCNGANGGTSAQCTLSFPATSAAEKVTLCNPFISTSAKASFSSVTLPDASDATVNGLTLVSGLANGSGDMSAQAVTTAINFGITNYAGSQSVASPGRNPATVACVFATAVTCVIANDATHPTVINKAVNMDPANALYGVDEANGATDAKKLAIANAVFARNNVCATTLTPAAATMTRSFTIANNRNTSGYRCVSGSAYIKMGVRTQVETGNQTANPTADADFKFVKVNFTDGCWGEKNLKTPADLPRLSAMGSKLAISDSWVAAVAPVDDGVVASAGSVYMFRRNTSTANWDYFSKITIPEAAVNDNMTAATLFGNKLVISSQKHSNQSGLAKLYVFDGSNWVYTQTFTPPNVQSFQLFGGSVSMSDTVLAIGAPAYSNVSSANDLSGIVYIYSCTTSAPYSCSYRYAISNTRKAGSAFGTAVSVSGSKVAVGAPQDPVLSDQGDGYVEVYDVTGAAVLNKFIEPSNKPNPVAAGDDPSGMRFGASVSLLGNKLAVGAPNLNTATVIFVGGAYYYADFNSAGKFIKNSTAVVRTNFGKGLALNSKGLYVGCPLCSTDQGVVRFYSNTSLAATTPSIDFTLFGLNASTNNAYGSAVAATDNYLAVGASARPDPNTYSGAAYVYKLP